MLYGVGGGGRGGETSDEGEQGTAEHVGQV